MYTEWKCSLYNDKNVLITDTTTATLTIGGKDQTVNFIGGTYDLTGGFVSSGDYSLTVPDSLGYQGTTFKGTVMGTDYTGIFEFLIVGIVIVVIILGLYWKFRGKRRGHIGYGGSLGKEPMIVEQE